MNLIWSKVDGDFIAKDEQKGNVFRLKRQQIGVLSGGWCYSLQVRKIDDIQFEYLSYAFVTHDDGYNAIKKYSVDGVRWSDSQEICKKADEVLRALYLTGEKDYEYWG